MRYELLRSRTNNRVYMSEIFHSADIHIFIHKHTRHVMPCRHSRLYTQTHQTCYTLQTFTSCYESCIKKFTLEQVTKAQRGSRDIALLLTSVLDGGGWSMPHPDRSTPGKDLVHIF